MDENSELKSTLNISSAKEKAGKELEQEKIETQKLTAELVDCREVIKTQKDKLQASHENVDSLTSDLRKKKQETEKIQEEKDEISSLLEVERAKTGEMQKDFEHLRDENNKVKNERQEK